MVVLSPAGPQWNSIRSRMFHRGTLLDRLAARMSIDNVYRVLVHYTYAEELSAQRRQAVCRNRLEGWHSARTRKPTEKATLRSGCGHLPGQHECARVRPAPTQGRPGGALGRAGERELAAHVCVRGRGRDSRRLPGLPLGAKHAFQSIPSRRGPEGLPGGHDGEGGGQAPRGDAAESLPDTQRPCRHFSGDEHAACQGDAVHVSRVLAEDAPQLRSLEGSEKQAAQDQTVSGPAAKGACRSPDLTSSPRTASTSIVQPGCTKLESCRRRTSGERWRRN